MNMHAAGPIIDDQNPLYCPALTAVAFLETLRHHIRSEGHSYRSNEPVTSFAERLDQSMDEKDLYRLLYRPLPPTDDGSESSSELNSIFSVPAWEHSTPAPRSIRRVAHPKPPAPKVKRKRSSSSDAFNTLLGPPKRERSSQSVNDSSFELSAKAERLRYFRDATDALFSPHDHGRSKITQARHGEPAKVEMQRKIRLLEGA